MNEVRLTLDSFLLLCDRLFDVTKEKERLRGIVVMQNHALEKLVSKSATEKRWVTEYWEDFARFEAENVDRAFMKAKESGFWPPKLMIP